MRAIASSSSTASPAARNSSNVSRPGCAVARQHHRATRCRELGVGVREQVDVVDAEEVVDGEQQARAALAQHVRGFVALEPRVDRHHPRTGAEDAERDHDELERVRSPDRDPVAGFDSRGHHCPGRSDRTLGQLGVGHPPVAVDHRLTIGEARRVHCAGSRGSIGNARRLSSSRPRERGDDRSDGSRGSSDGTRRRAGCGENPYSRRDVSNLSQIASTVPTNTGGDAPSSLPVMSNCAAMRSRNSVALAASGVTRTSQQFTDSVTSSGDLPARDAPSCTQPIFSCMRSGVRSTTACRPSAPRAEPGVHADDRRLAPASRSTRGLPPPTKNGGCGSCTGFGRPSRLADRVVVAVEGEGRRRRTAP